VLQLLLAAVAAYVIGCLVGAYYIVRVRRGLDVRESGSGNAGARNVFRSGDQVGALLTFAWDALKGALAVWLADRIAPGDVATSIAIVSVVVGHIWPAQLRFRGGKGVATTLGAAIAVLPRTLTGSWVLVAGVVVASVIVIVMHHPSMDRRRPVRPMRPAQENAS
jgi:glycerol-3-phosphate acyltransferase PlsY